MQCYIYSIHYNDQNKNQEKNSNKNIVCVDSWASD